MNAPIRIAQAGTTQGANQKVTVITLEKPSGGQAITVKTGFEGKVKLDFSKIADDRITIVRVGETAVIFFHDNKSTITLDPFFGSDNLPLAFLEFDLGGNRIFTAEQIAGILPFTVYQGILPAAGEGGGDPQDSGANFNPTLVAELPPILLNELLPPEALPPIDIQADLSVFVAPELVITGTFFGLVEEEQFFNGQEGEELVNPTDAGIGNEDVDDLNGFDTDEFPPDFFDTVTLHISGDLSALVSGGTPPYSFQFIDPTTDGDAENDFVHDTDSNLAADRIVSQGDEVHFEFVDSTQIRGVASDGRIVFIVTLDNTTGQIDFFLNDQIDHPLASLDDGTNLQGIFEEMLALNLSSVIEISDAGGQVVNLGDVPGGPVVSIGVIDDTPILGKDKEIRTVNEDDIQTGDGDPDGSYGTSPQDGDFDGSFTGNPGDGIPGPATIFGSLAGTVLVGADKHPETYDAKFSFINGDDTDLSYLVGLGLTSKDGVICYDVDGGVLYGFVDNDGGPGHQFYNPGEDRLVFALILSENGDYTFELHDQVDHDAPYDDFPFFPVLPGDTLNPPADQNHDLQETIDGDVVFIDFGSLIKAVDYDNDAIILDNKLQIAITDDIPELTGECSSITVDEDDIETIGWTDPNSINPGSQGTAPDDGDAIDGSFTGTPGVDTEGPANATSVGSLSGLVVNPGADEDLTFRFANEAAVRAYLTAQGLESQDGDLSYDVVGNILYGFVDNDPGTGHQTYDVSEDRLVFTLELDPGTGVYKFSLFDQLDHQPGGGENSLTIDFGGALEAVDFDQDAVSLAGKVKVHVTDDVPVLGSGSVCVIADEDDIQTVGFTPPPGVNPGSTGTSPQDGNADGSYTNNPGDGTPGPATVASGSLGSLVQSGADEPLTFGFASEADVRAYLESLHLTSQDGPLSYDMSPDGLTIFGFVNAGAPGVIYNAGSDRLVFEFEITNTDTGAFEFRLFDQLDHDDPDGGALSDENFDLEGEGANPDVSSIQFGNIIKATDFDGDSVSLTNKVEVKIRDDVPELKGKECLEPGTSYQGADPSDLLFQLPAGGAIVHIDISNINSVADYENSIGYYFADAAGNPINGRILADNAQSDDNEQIVIQPGDVPPGAVFVGFFIIPDGNDENSISDGDFVTFVFEGGQWVAYHDGNPLDSAQDAILFSDRRLNPDINGDGDSDPGDDFEVGGGAYDSNWEDKHDDSDADFNDVQFDVKVCATPVVFMTVDEDDIQTVGVTPPPGVNPGSTGTSPQDGNADGSYTGNPGDGVPGPAFVSGTLAGVVVESGADENLTFSFVSEEDLREYLESLHLTSQAGPLSYDTSGDGLTVYGFVNAGGPGVIYNAGTDRLVFTFQITNTTTGAFEFKLYDQLDHDDPDGGALSDENFDLEGEGANPDVLSIDFGSIIEAEDFDHDRVVLEDKVIIQVRDDVPEVHSGTAAVSVDEDDLNNYDPTDANNDGIYGSQGSSPGGLTTVNGAIGAGVVTAGADEPLTFSFVSANDVRNYLENLGLRSKGERLSYDLNTPGVIKAFDQEGTNNGDGFTSFDTGSANDRLVFTFTLNPDGTFSFTLYDQLDHDVPNDDAPTDNTGTGPGADENVDLRDDLPSDLTYIDFGAIIEATDFDGDSVLLTNKVRVEVVDDIPTQKSSGTTSIQVEEDELNSGSEPSDLSIGISDGDGFDDDANISAASILGLFNSGADEPITVALNSSASGNVQTTGGVNVTSKGVQVKYAFSGGAVIGYADSNGDNNSAGERVVFRITASGGNFVFDLEDQLDHSPGISATDIETMTLNIGTAFRVTDFDGDSVVPTGSLLQGVHVVVENDIPAITISTQQPQLTVTHDETGGLQNAGANTPNVEDNNDGDVAGSTLVTFNGVAGTSIASLFNGIAGLFLDDPHVSNDAASTNSAIGFARSAGAIFGVNVTPGADEPVSVVNYQLSVTNNGPSGLVTTEGKLIHLLQLNSTTAVGYYDNDGDNVVQLDGSDPIALALRIDPLTGVVYVAQWVSLDHPTEADFTGDPSYDEAVTFNSGTISIQAFVTDNDGDLVGTPWVDLQNKVFFEDDGPKVNGVTPNVGYGPELIVNGSFELGHGLVGNNWEIFNSITSWEDGADGIPFEVQTGGAGGVAAQDGNALIELDSDTLGNPDNPLPDVNPTNFTNATIAQTIAGTEAGQQYELTFWYRPRGGDGTNNGGMKVFFEGNEVLDIPSNPNPYSPNAWTKITLLVTATGPGAELAFQGQGTENEHGAFLDNVSLRSVTTHTLDDEDTTLSPATEIQGGPGDDGAGVTASGTVSFTGGADGAKISVNPIDGLTAIYVNAANVGIAYGVNQAWTAGVNASGVAAGYENGGTLRGTMNTPDGIKDVFTLEVDNAGNYLFTLIAPLNHPEQDDGNDANGIETSWEDNIPLNFGFAVTDGDNDKATGTLAFNIDDDSPEFVSGGIEDGEVVTLGVGVTENLNIVFGADGMHAQTGLAITGWPDLPGVTETLSPDGKTLTAVITGPNTPLYTLVLNNDGTYTFTQHGAFPGGSSVLPEVDTTDAFGPTPTRDYAGFTVNSASLLNGSIQGIGVANNGIADGESLKIVFDDEMSSVDLGINHIGNGTMEIDWVAYALDGTTVVASGSTASFNSDGTITITPGVSFFSIQLTGDELVGPSPQFRITLVGGDTVGSNPIDEISFAVTGMDGDEDAVTDVFTVELIDEIPFGEERGAFGVVEEEHLQNYLQSGTPNVEGSNGNEDDYEAASVPATEDDDDTVAPNDFDNTTDVTTGTLAISGGNGGNEFSIIATNGQPVLFTLGGIHVLSKGEPVYFVNGPANVLYGVANGGGAADSIDSSDDRIVFQIDLNPTSGEFTFTLLDQLDHHPYVIDGGPIGVDNDEGVMTINLANVFEVEDDAAQTHVFQDVKVAVIDDIPVILPSTTGPVSFVMDETSLGAGPFLGFDNADDDDVLGQQRPDTTAPFTPFGSRTLDGTTLFGSVSYGADEPGSQSYGLVLKNSVVTLGIGTATDSGYNVTQPAFLGNPDWSGVDPSIFWVPVSATQINGLVGGLGGDIALTIRIDSLTGAITVEQFLAFDHGVDGNNHDRPQSLTDGSLNIYATLTATDADGDNVTATSASPVELTIEDTGIVVSGISSDTEVLDESHTTEGGATINGTWSIVVGNDGLKEFKVSVAGEPDQFLSLDDLNDTAVFNLTSGVLTVNANETWTFNPNGIINANTVVSFTIRIEDGDTDFDPETHNINIANVQVFPDITTENATVDEDGLANANLDGSPLRLGETDANENAVQTGTFTVEYHTPADFAGSSVQLLDTPGLDGQLLALNGNPITFVNDGPSKLVGTAAGVVGTIITIEITDSAAQSATSIEYTYTVTLLQPIKHASNDDEDFDTLSGITVRATDGDGGETDDATFSVTIYDDKPVAENDSADTEVTATAKTYSLMLILDVSESLSDGDLDTAVSNLKDLLDAYAVVAAGGAAGVEVSVITFGGGAFTRLSLGTIAQAKAALDGATDGNREDPLSGTNYDAPIANATADLALWDPASPTHVNTVYFVSDGAPTVGDESVGLSDPEETAWEATLSGKGATAIAIGVNVAGIDADLQDVAFPDTNVISDTDIEDLLDVLLDTVPDPTSGNVLTNDITTAFGADGGYIKSIEIDSVLYTFNGTNLITPSGVPDAGHVVLDNGGTYIQVTTALGGTFTFHFATSVDGDAGEWGYTPPASIDPGDVGQEAIAYTLIDNDGDESSAALTINIPPSFTVSDQSVEEGGNLVFTVNLSHESALPLNFAFALTDGTTSADDYDHLQVSVNGLPATSIAAGTQMFSGTSFTVTVFSNEDVTFEPDETFTLTVSNAGGIGFGTTANASDDGTGTILNDDAAPNVAPVLALHGGEYVFDQFSSASLGNNNGSVNWDANWDETNDSGGDSATAGEIQVVGGELRFGNTSTAEITREVNLSSAVTATLTFDVHPSAPGTIEAGEEVIVYFAADGSTFVEIDRLDLTDGTVSKTIPLTGPFENDARIRFSTEAFSATDEFMFVDNVKITYTTAVAQEDYETTFTENGSAVPVAVVSKITDADDTNMESGSIVLTNKQTGDFLLLNGAALSNGSAGALFGINYLVTDAGGSITIALVGSANLAAYQNFINAVTFSNSSENPSGVDRLVDVIVNDGLANSNTATTTINVVPVNDPPTAVDDIVRTNFDGVAFTVPEWAFLRNDSDPEGSALDVTGESNNDDLAVTLNVGSLTIDDEDNADGGDFDYTLTAGGQNDTANVQVFNLNGGGNVTGTAANEILVGNSSNNTFTGGQGADILFGGTGFDIFAFAAGDSGQTDLTKDIIGDYLKGAVGVGDEIDFTTASMVIGGSAAAATAGEASISATTGVATFAGGSGTTLADALSDIAARMNSVGGTTQGEFALFQVNGAGDYHLFISDNVAGVSANDIVNQLFGVGTIGGINLTTGDLTITS